MITIVGNSTLHIVVVRVEEATQTTMTNTTATMRTSTIGRTTMTMEEATPHTGAGALAGSVMLMSSPNVKLKQLIKRVEESKALHKNPNPPTSKARLSLLRRSKN